jgi:short-subunit dehydrogenase
MNADIRPLAVVTGASSGIGLELAREGRILITGSIAGFMPGTFQAVYNGTRRSSIRSRGHYVMSSRIPG